MRQTTLKTDYLRSKKAGVQALSFEPKNRPVTRSQVRADPDSFEEVSLPYDSPYFPRLRSPSTSPPKASQKTPPKPTQAARSSRSPAKPKLLTKRKAKHNRKQVNRKGKSKPRPHQIRKKNYEEPCLPDEPPQPEVDIRSVCNAKQPKSEKANPRPKSVKGIKNFQKKANRATLRQEKLTEMLNPVAKGTPPSQPARIVAKKPKLQRDQPTLLNNPTSDLSDYSALLKDGEDEFKRRLGIMSTVTSNKAAVSEVQEEIKNEAKKPIAKKDFTPAFKYAELLKRELPLPPHYKELLVVFQYLDQMVNVQRGRKKTPKLEVMVKLMNVQRQCDFNEKILRQILFIVPDFYIHRWSKSDESNPTQAGGNLELVVDFPISMIEAIEKSEQVSYKDAPNMADERRLPVETRIPHELFKRRVQVFKKRLIAATYEQYLHYLEALPKEDQPNFSPLEEQVWPHNFNLEGVPDIELATLKTKHQRKSRSVQDAVSERGEQTDILLEKATKAARAKIASEGRSASKGSLIIEDDEEEDKLPFNIKKVNIDEESAFNSFSEFQQFSTQATMCHIPKASPRKVGATPLILRSSSDTKRYSNSNTPKRGRPKESFVISSGLLARLKQKQQASKIMQEWSKPHTDRLKKEQELELLKVIAFQLRNFFLSARALSLSQVVAKLVFNFETLHNNYLRTNQVEGLVRKLHAIVPKFVEIIELPGEKKPYVRVDNSEINANGVIKKIESAILS